MNGHVVQIRDYITYSEADGFATDNLPVAAIVAGGKIRSIVSKRKSTYQLLAISCLGLDLGHIGNLGRFYLYVGWRGNKAFLDLCRFRTRNLNIDYVAINRSIAPFASVIHRCEKK